MDFQGGDKIELKIKKHKAKKHEIVDKLEMLKIVSFSPFWFLEVLKRLA